MGYVAGVFKWIRRHKLWSILIIVGLGIIAAIFRPRPPVPPATQSVKRHDFVQSVSVNGTVDSETKVNLTFPVNGKIIFIGAKKGDTVKKYQTIAMLDERTLEDNLQSAVKAYENQKISFDIVNDFNGDRDLSDTGLSISARRQLQTALNTLDQAKISAEIQKIAKEQAVLFSPIDGILTRADVEVPNVNATIATTFSVADPKNLVFKMDVDEADIGKVKIKQKVNVTLDAFSDNTLSLSVNKIDFVSHATSNGGNAFTVEAVLPDNDGNQYRIGMNGNADITTAQKHNILTVPIASISDGNIVYIKTKKGYEKRKITPGLQNDTDVEVVNGLSEGDQIVLDPTKIPASQLIR